jgi:hypothetical protein
MENNASTGIGEMHLYGANSTHSKLIAHNDSTISIESGAELVVNGNLKIESNGLLTINSTLNKLKLEDTVGTSKIELGVVGSSAYTLITNSQVTTYGEIRGKSLYGTDVHASKFTFGPTREEVNTYTIKTKNSKDVDVEILVLKVG